MGYQRRVHGDCQSITGSTQRANLLINFDMSTQHYAAFIKLTKKDVVECKKNAQTPSRVLPHRQGRLNRHPRLGWQAEAEEARQQGQGHLQATQVPPAQSVQQETPVVRQKAQWRSKSN